MKKDRKNDPTLACLRRAPRSTQDALIMATSDTHAREVATDLWRRGYTATRCEKFIMTNAPVGKAARASKLKVKK